MEARSWPSIELDPAWHEAIATRVSRRAYDGRPIGAGTLAALQAAAARLSTDGTVRVTLVVGETDSADSCDTSRCDALLRGFVGDLGKTTGVPAVAVFSGPDDGALAVGYIGEAFVLEATRLGLGTCWVAGNFDARRAAAHAGLAKGERAHAVTPVGHSPERLSVTEHAITRFVHARRRLEAERIAPGCTGWPSWARSATEAVRLAPSGGNGQPWRLRFEDGVLVLAEPADGVYWTHHLDLGIAMLHAELGALAAGVAGRWQLDEGVASTVAVARFVPSGPIPD